jgi:hypothetical protein
MNGDVLKMFIFYCFATLQLTPTFGAIKNSGFKKLIHAPAITK